MDTFLVDEGLRGVISALFFTFTLKRTPKKIEYEKDYVFCPEDTLFTLRTCEKDVKRVENALIKYGGLDILRDMRLCLCYDNNSPYLAVFNYGKAVLTARRNLKNELAYPDVWEFFSRINKVNDEVLITSQQLRFRESRSGTLFAEYCPNNDITRLLLPVFFKQYKNRSFIIHDLRRGNIGISNGKQFYLENSLANCRFNQEQAQKHYKQLSEKYCFNK